MKKLIFILLAAVMPSLIVAQEIISSKQLSEFDKVQFVGKLSVKLVKAEKTGIEVKLTDIESKKFEWGIKNGILYAKLRAGSSTSQGEITLYYNDLTSVKANGADVYFETKATFNMLDIDINSGGSVDFKGKATDLLVSISGNSRALISGSTRYLTLDAGTGSKINARDMESMAANVIANSGSEIFVWSIDRLEIKSQTASSVFYKGDPKILRTTNGTLGTINNIGK